MSYWATEGATIYFEVSDLESAKKHMQAHDVAIDTEPHMLFSDSDGTSGPDTKETWMMFIRDPSKKLSELRKILLL